MKTILALWEGKLEPGRHCGTGKEMREVELLIERNRSKLFIVAEQAFYKGYCLGTQLTAEALTSSIP